MRGTRADTFTARSSKRSPDHARSRRCDVQRARHHAAMRSSFPEAAPAVRCSCRFSPTRSAFPLPALRARAAQASVPRSAPPSARACTRISRRPLRAWKNRDSVFVPQPANVETYRRMNATVYRDIRNVTDPVLEQVLSDLPLMHDRRARDKDRNMALSRTAIVQGLQDILGPQNVITDEQELKQSSIDRLRLYEDVHGVFTQPLPAAVAMARSTGHVAAGAEVRQRASASTSCRARVAPRPKAGSRPRCRIRSCSTARA